jgi:hypothetical protein
LRGLAIFNVPVGEEQSVTVKLRDKAMQVKKNDGSVCQGPGGRIPPGATDDAAILAATPHNILVEDVHAGVDRRNGGTRELLHHGSS